MALSILSFVEAIFSYIFQGILGILSGAVDSIFRAIGIDANEVLNGFVQQINSFGVCMPVILVVIFGICGAGIYLELSMGAEINDID